MSDLVTQVAELRDLLSDYQTEQNAVNVELIRVIGAANRLDDYRGQQIAAIEQQVNALSAAVRAQFADPVDVAERLLRSVDND